MMSFFKHNHRMEELFFFYNMQKLCEFLGIFIEKIGQI